MWIVSPVPPTSKEAWESERQTKSTSANTYDSAAAELPSISYCCWRWRCCCCCCCCPPPASLHVAAAAVDDVDDFDDDDVKEDKGGEDDDDAAAASDALRIRTANIVGGCWPMSSVFNSRLGRNDGLALCKIGSKYLRHRSTQYIAR